MGGYICVCVRAHACVCLCACLCGTVLMHLNKKKTV